jgi:hypothetical protein
MRAWRVIMAVLREIFDESAYERYCVHHGLLRGRDSYATFIRRQRLKAKCC